MRPTLAEAEQMTIAEFLDFTDERPDGACWELIEGVPIMNPSPTDVHQTIVMNTGALLVAFKDTSNAPWIPLLGVGTRVPASPNSLPRPDVLVKAGALTGTSVTDEALVLFEVLARGNKLSDRTWRRRVYASVPNCRHYVTIATKVVSVTRDDRARGWSKAANLVDLADTLDLPALGCALPLAEIYRWTPLAR